MKKIRVFILFIILVSLCFGCSKKERVAEVQETKEESFSFKTLSEGSFLLTTGEGWASMISIDENGGFGGEYYESDMSEQGIDYDGVIKSCSFYGQLKELEKIDDYTYSSLVVSLATNSNEEKEYVEDSVKHIIVAPKGIEKGANIVIHLPGKDTNLLDSQFVDWIKNGYYYEGDKLPVIGIETIVNSEVYGWAMQGK